jgi:hypothetical protein
MSQHDLTIANQAFPAFRSDLNNALQALGSTQSGSSAPSPTFAHQMWIDTSSAPNVLKVRNADNDAWITVGTLNQSSDRFNLAVQEGGTGASTQADARTNLGLGSIATQDASSVSITGGTITGITDLTVADGGTGRSTLTAENVLLGNGTSAVNFVAPGTNGNVLTSNGTTWTSAAPSVSSSSFTGANQSLATAGYQKLPGGLIIQWGTAGPISGTASASISFSITFPTACLGVSLSRSGPNSTNAGDKRDSHFVYSTSTTAFSYTSNYEGITNVVYTWIAIGY